MRVLIADDDPLHTRLLEGLLVSGGYGVLKAVNGVEALKTLEGSEPIQLVIADWMMPEMDGIQLCREIRKRFNEPYVYIILLTARDQRDDIVEGLDAGADDYLIKPVHHSELNARIRAAQRIIDLQDRLLAAQERLRIQAMYDALTGLWNRRAIFEALARELDRARRQQSPLAVVMIDLDHFKRINDTYGHLAGDDVLREAAQRLRETVRSYDFVGRYGGEEFLIVAPGSESSRAMDLAERIRRLFADNPIRLSTAAIPVTLSLGVVCLQDGQAAEISKVLSAADDALYSAKGGGRNNSVLGSVGLEEGKAVGQ
jgi:diguanylate cyclase (GGDEF)-like protein